MITTLERMVEWVVKYHLTGKQQRTAYALMEQIARRV